MGFYCSTQVVNKNNKVICTINTEKYGIGYGVFWFRKEDYAIDVPKHIYVAKTSVPTALERIEKIYHEVIEKRDQKIKEGMKYNAWTQRAINYAIDFMEEVLSVLKMEVCHDSIILSEEEINNYLKYFDMKKRKKELTDKEWDEYYDLECNLDIEHCCMDCDNEVEITEADIRELLDSSYCHVYKVIKGRDKSLDNV